MATYPTLPEDLIREILLRLPVRSLLRFKAVCKNWYALITSSNFIDIQYRQPSNPIFKVMVTERDLESCNRTYFRPLQFENIEYRSSFYSLSVFCDGITNRVEDRIMPFALDEEPDLVDIVGSINGLLCLVIYFSRHDQHRYHVLWNPATRQYRYLPPHIIKHSYEIYYCSDDMGFGFHHRTNDYKLLNMKRRKNAMEGNVEAEVYTFSTDSWRHVQDVPDYESAFSIPPVILNGKMYFLISKHDQRPYVLTFDMGDDTFSMMEAVVPYYGQEVLMQLMVYKESLALFRNRKSYSSLKSSYRFEIYVMRNESWIKQFKCCVRPTTSWIRPLGTWYDEEIVLVEQEDHSRRVYHKKGLLLFNLRTQQWKNLLVDGAQWFNEPHNYVESMVSIYDTKHQDGDERLKIFETLL